MSFTVSDGKRGDSVDKTVKVAAPDSVGQQVGDCNKVGRADNVKMPDAADDEDDDAQAVRSAASDPLGVGDPLWLRSPVEVANVETLLEWLTVDEN